VTFEKRLASQAAYEGSIPFARSKNSWPRKRWSIRQREVPTIV
jgi:hypothetical protein